MASQYPKIIYFVAVDWFFVSHFIDRAKTAQRAGYEVVLLTSIRNHKSIIEKEGFRIIELNIDRGSLNPISAFKLVLALIKTFKSESPDILHQVAIKPILLGSFAAKFAGVTRVVNAIVGGGYIFTSTSPVARLLRPLLKGALRLLLNPPGSRVIFENKDDLALFVRTGQVRPEAAILIRGAGVNFEIYREKSRPSIVPLVVLPARLLWDKGLAEFIEAVRLLRRHSIIARFAIVGGEDPENRSSIPKAQLAEWKAECVVEFWGFRTDMASVLSEADIVCLPSYREGLPKALLEGMAAGLPCVATDVPGCREAVIHGENGLLVQPRSPEALANALRQLIFDPDLRIRMGQRGRLMAANEFSSSIICQQTMRVYRDLLES